MSTKMSSSRKNNVAVGNPALSLPTPAGSSTTCEFSDADWVAQRYLNFRHHVRGLVPQEPKLLEWSLWLDKLPLSVFLAGGDGELKGVRGAAGDDKRAAEAGVVLERWALDYQFELDRISDADKEKLRRYISLFSIA